MKDVIVVTSCTERKGLADAYDRQLADAGVDHFFETIPIATSSFTMKLRLSYWRGLAEKFVDYQMIVITDAWDVLFFGTKQDLLNKLQTILISGERNCFPGPEFGEEDLTNEIVGPTPWKYANPGMIAASPAHLLEWCKRAENFRPLDISDQAWCNRRLADVDSSWLVSLDETTRLFYVISYSDGRLEDGALQIKDGRLWNSRCDTYPNFFHFAGHGPWAAEHVLPGKAAPGYQTMRLIRSYIESKG